MGQNQEEPKWWEVLRDEQDFPPLFDVNQGFLVETGPLFARLINQEDPFELTGLADLADSFFVQAKTKALEINKHSPLPDGLRLDSDHIPHGAIELDGATLVLFEDADDGLRSMCHICLLVPGQHLHTHLPRLMVGIQRSDSSEWDDPRYNEKPEPSMIDFKCLVTDQVLVTLGTKYGDQIYPEFTFYHDPHQLTLSTVEQTHNKLSVGTPGSSRLSSRSRL